MIGDYSVYSRKRGVDLYFHTFVMWASDWGWIEQTLNSRRSPPEAEVFLSLQFKIKVTFGEMSLELRQTNRNVAINNVNVVVDELPS